MAKNKLIKSSRGNGYGILDEETNLVTPISLNEAKLIESKKGNGFGVQIGDSVLPVDISGLGNDDINTLKKKGDTGLSGQTNSWGSIINPLSEKKFSLDTPSEMGRSAQSFAELDKEQGASSKDMMRRALSAPSSSMGLSAGMGGFGSAGLPSLEPSSEMGKPKKLSDEEKEYARIDRAKKDYLDDVFKSEGFLPTFSMGNTSLGGGLVKLISNAPTALGAITEFASNVIDEIANPKMPITSSGFGIEGARPKQFDLEAARKEYSKPRIESSESIAGTLYELGNNLSQVGESYLRNSARSLGVKEQNVGKGFTELISEGETRDAFSNLGVQAFSQLPQVLAMSATGGGAGAVFATSTLLGATSALQEEYGMDGNITAANAIKSLGKGIVEGVTETIFRTDIQAARQLGKGMFSLSGDSIQQGLKSLIKEEGKDAVKEMITRNYGQVFKKALGGAVEEGIEEVLSSAGSFVVDRLEDGKWSETDYQKLLMEASDSFFIGAATGGLLSAASARASMKPLDKLQQKNIEKYQELANDENQPKQVRDIALKQIDDIVKYNADKNYQNYTAIAMLPTEQRIEALKIKNSIDDLEAARSEAKSPEFDAIVERQKKEGQAQLDEIFNNRYKTLEAERAEARKSVGEKTLDEATSFMQENNTENAISEALGSVSSRFENNQPIEVDEVNEATDRLFNIADEIDSNESLSDPAKNLILEELYDKIDKLQKYEFTTKTEITTIAQESTTKGAKRVGSVERKNARQTAITANRFDGEQITFTTPEGNKVNGIASVDKKGKISVKPRNVFSISEQEESAQEIPFDSNFLEFKESKLDDNGNVSSVVLSDTRNNNTFEISNPELALDLAIKAKQDKLGAIEDAVFEPIFERVQLESKQKTTTTFVNKAVPQQQVEGEIAPVEVVAEEVVPQNDSTSFVVTPEITNRRQPIQKREKGSRERRQTVLLDTISDGVKGILKRLNDTLKSIDPNADIIIYASEADMVNGLMASGLNRQNALSSTRTANGLFTRETDGKVKIHVLSAIFNSELVPTEESATTIPHEIGHVALVKLAQANPAEFQVMKERLIKALPKEISDKLNAFEKEGYDVNAEEWLAQLGALLTTRQAKFEKTTMRAIARGIALAIRDFIQKIAIKYNNESLYGFADSLFREQREIQDVVDFFTKFADSVRNGRSVELSYVERKAAGATTAQAGTAVKPQFNASKAEFKTISNTKEWEKQSSTTQRANTKGSYEKVASKILADNPNAKVLDFGAGLGIGSDAMSGVIGNRVDSYEPFADNWQGSTPPTFSNVEQIKDKYDNIVSLNVLNVVKKSVRDSIVYDIYNLLKEGGSAYISARKYNGDIVTAKNKETSSVGAEEKSRVFTRNVDGQEVSIYQKGFDGNDLVDYVSGLLGDKAIVTKDNSFGATGVVVKKPVFDESEKQIQDMMKGLVVGTEEYARAARMIPAMRLKAPYKVDFNLVDQSRIALQDETEVKAQKSTIKEGKYQPSVEKGATEEQKAFAKYIRLVKGMTENDVWLAKAIHSEVLRGNPIFELGNKEAIEAEFVNLIDKFMEDGFNTNGKYIFKEYTGGYIQRNVTRFTENYNSAFLYYWNAIQNDSETRNSVYKEIRDRQNNSHETNFMYFGRNQNYNPAFKYLMLRDSIYYRPRVKNAETGELDSGKLKDSEFKDSDSTPITYNPDLVEKVYNEAAFTIGDTWELYTREAMKLPKEDKVKGMEPYFFKDSSTKEGKWYKFPQNGGKQVVDDLSRLAKTSWNYPAKWCTAQESYAISQNKQGDFYIFVDDKTGDARIAVRYVGDAIEEVSGLAAGQNTYPEDSPILDEVVSAFKGGDRFKLTAKVNRLMGEFILNMPSDKRAQYALKSVDEDNAIEDGAIDALTKFSLEDIADIYSTELKRYQDNPLQANLQRVISANASAISEKLGLNKNAFSVTKIINSKEDAEGVQIILKKVIINAPDIVLPNIKNIKEIVIADGASADFPELQTVEFLRAFAGSSIKANKATAIKNFIIATSNNVNPINVQLPNVEYIGLMRGLITGGSNVDLGSLKKLVVDGYLYVEGNNLSLPNLEEIKVDSIYGSGELELTNASIIAPKLKSANMVSISLVNSDFSAPELGGSINQLTLSKNSSFNGGEIIAVDNLSFDEVDSNIPFTAKKIGSIGKLMLLNSNVSINPSDYNSLNNITDINSLNSTINITAEDVVYSNISIDLSTLTFPTPNFKAAPTITAKESSIRVDNSRVKAKTFYADNVNITDSIFDISEFKEEGLGVINTLKLYGIKSKIVGEISQVDNLKMVASKLNLNTTKVKTIIAENNSQLDVNELVDNSFNGMEIILDYSSSIKAGNLISNEVYSIKADNESSVNIENVETKNGEGGNIFTLTSFNKSSISVKGASKIFSLEIEKAQASVDGNNLNIPNLYLYGNSGLYSNNIDTIGIANFSGVISYPNSNYRKVDIKQINFIERLFVRDESNLELNSVVKLDELVVEGESKLSIKNNLILGESSVLNDSTLTIGGTEVKSQKKTFDLVYSANEAIEEQDKLTWGKLSDWLASKFYERSNKIKKSFEEAEMEFALYTLFLKAGSTPYATREFDEKYAKIFRGLSKADKRALDSVVLARRVVAIDTNFDSRGVARPLHQPFDDPNNKKVKIKANKESAEKLLGQLDSILGVEKARDINDRATQYFEAFSNILDMKLSAGIIDLKSYNMFKNYEYSPRQFLEYFMPEDVSYSSYLEKGALIKSREFKNIRKGSEGFMITDTERLLKSAMIAAHKQIMTNRALSYMYDEGIGQNLTWIKEPRYKIYKDGTIKLNEDGSLASYEAENGFEKMMFKRNGKKVEFQLKKSLANEFYDRGLLDNSSIGIKAAGILSGAWLTQINAVGINPAFGLFINPSMDLSSQVFNTTIWEHKGNVAKQSLSALKGFLEISGRLVKKDLNAGNNDDIKKLILEYGRAGGFMTTITDDSNILGKLGSFMGYAGNVTEIASKLSAYKNTKEDLIEDYIKQNGINPTGEDMNKIEIKASYIARSSMDFHRGGTYSKIANKIIPFFNVGMQVKKITIQNMRNNPVSFLKKVSQGIQYMIGLTLYNLLVGADDYEKDKTLQRDKLNKVIIMYPFKFGDAPRGYMALPVGTSIKAFLNIGQVIGESLYYKMSGRVQPKEDNTLKRHMQDMIKMFGRDALAMTPVIGVPTLKSAISYYANFDFYNFKPLSYDKLANVYPSAEGAANDDILSSFKLAAKTLDKWTDPEGIGKGAGYISISPERAQKTAEMVWTSPSYAPHILTAYSLLDNFVGNIAKDALAENKVKESIYIKDGLGNLVPEMLGKGTGRMFKSTKPENYDKPDYDKIADIKEQMDVDNKRRNTVRREISADISELMDTAFENKMTDAQIQKQVNDYTSKIKDRTDNKYANNIAELNYIRKTLNFPSNIPYYETIKYGSSDPNLRAKYVYKAFGDISDNPELSQDLGRIGFTTKDKEAYSKLLKQKEND